MSKDFKLTRSNYFSYALDLNGERISLYHHCNENYISPANDHSSLGRIFQYHWFILVDHGGHSVCCNCGTEFPSIKKLKVMIALKDMS